MAIILSTETCYEAYNILEGAWVIGSDFTEEEGFDLNTVDWSWQAWEDEKDYFKSFLDEEIKKYEKRYNTTVEYIALAGRVGLWNGSPVGGRMIYRDENPLEYMGDVDSIEISIGEDRVITLLGHHHDGTHEMHIYFITENKVKQLINDDGQWDYRDFEKIYEEFSPLKLTKKNQYFRV